MFAFQKTQVIFVQIKQLICKMFCSTRQTFWSVVCLFLINITWVPGKFSYKNQDCLFINLINRHMHKVVTARGPCYFVLYLRDLVFNVCIFMGYKLSIFCSKTASGPTSSGNDGFNHVLHNTYTSSIRAVLMVEWLWSTTDLLNEDGYKYILNMKWILYTQSILYNS